MTAVLSTADGIAFVGEMNRMFRAVDVKTGKILWETRLGTSVQGFPLAFSIEGWQYIAVTTGLGVEAERFLWVDACSHTPHGKPGSGSMVDSFGNAHQPSGQSDKAVEAVF
jgi:hypothetical protein